MGIGKNGSSKRSTNLAGFPRFSKKNRQEHRAHPPDQRHLQENPASRIRAPKRAAKSGSPYDFGNRQAQYEGLLISPIRQPVWLFISWPLAFSPQLSWQRAFSPQLSWQRAFSPRLSWQRAFSPRLSWLVLLLRVRCTACLCRL